MRPLWMLVHLAERTVHQHPHADGDRLSILDNATADNYRPFLAKIYSFESAVEAACAATPGVGLGLLRTHFKTNALAADLEALRNPTTRSANTVPARFERPDEALTWLWVVHRNTLLHGLIYRYLSGEIPLSVQRAGAYLSIFGGRAGVLMRDLGDELGSVATSASVVERMVTAANRAFDAQHVWYRRCYQSPERPPLTPQMSSSRAA